MAAFNADFEPFFFHTQGKGVIYLAIQYAGDGGPGIGKTYIATGAFQNMNPSGDGIGIYYMDNRYTDQMNTASIHGKVNVSDTVQLSPESARQLIQHYRIRVDQPVTIYKHENDYWCVVNHLAHTLPQAKMEGLKRRRSRSKSPSPNRTQKVSRVSAPRKSSKRSPGKSSKRSPGKSPGKSSRKSTRASMKKSAPRSKK
jgi:hypothetical protein